MGFILVVLFFVVGYSYFVFSELLYLFLVGCLGLGFFLCIIGVCLVVVCLYSLYVDGIVGCDGGVVFVLWCVVFVMVLLLVVFVVLFDVFGGLFLMMVFMVVVFVFFNLGWWL